MHKMIIVLAAVAFSGVQVLSDDNPHYIGVDKCAKMCHKSEAKGNQYGIWKKNKHANAYNDLGTERAKEVAKKAGVEGDPQKAVACLKCHTTAYGVSNELIDSTFKVENGVQCESCHGPGSKYSKMSIMKDKQKSTDAGLVEPDESVCIKCHNSSNPVAKEFHFKEMAQTIAHPNPKNSETNPVSK